MSDDPLTTVQLCKTCVLSSPSRNLRNSACMEILSSPCCKLAVWSNSQYGAASLSCVHRELTRPPIVVIVARPAHAQSSMLRELTVRVIIGAVLATATPPAGSIRGSILSSLSLQSCALAGCGRPCVTLSRWTGSLVQPAVQDPATALDSDQGFTGIHPMRPRVDAPP